MGTHAPEGIEVQPAAYGVVDPADEVGTMAAGADLVVIVAGRLDPSGAATRIIEHSPVPVVVADIDMPPTREGGVVLIGDHPTSRTVAERLAGAAVEQRGPEDDLADASVAVIGPEVTRDAVERVRTDRGLVVYLVVVPGRPAPTPTLEPAST
jgi:hypothetical protein